MHKRRNSDKRSFLSRMTSLPHRSLLIIVYSGSSVRKYLTIEARQTLEPMSMLSSLAKSLSSMYYRVNPTRGIHYRVPRHKNQHTVA